MANSSSKRLEQALKTITKLELILDNIYNGVMVTDENGYVTHFNTPYGKFLGVDPAQQIGRHCTEVVENSRMHIVAKTGVPEINKTHVIKGQKMVVQRIPIRHDGKIIAVFGQVMFKNVRDVGKLARKLSLLETKLEQYEDELLSLRSTRYTIHSIAGESEAIKSLRQEALKAAGTHLPVLITGESGTGKELFAQAVHHASPRKLFPFVRINCATIPKDLLESELFGYEPGAFTGASPGGKPGKFELANGGTVFLDEIGDLPLDMQPKLLRVLEEREVERLGGTTPVRVDFRLICATNQDLDRMAQEGRFRKDLLYRINAIWLHIPPLRERKRDIRPLSDHLLNQVVTEIPRSPLTIDDQAVKALEAYDWPGNVRELSNVLERLSFSLDHDVITLRDLPFTIASAARKREPSVPGSFSLRRVLERTESETIREALAASRGNKSEAARMLGIHRTLLYKKMKKLGVLAGASGGDTYQI
jgi:transcriptional regulator with PAS, ATPase and Fis domain|uniref:PAS domain-containing protein n=1 Tax=Desulfomonile tiedjei TaxID=2358 RepID=A0A7C4ASN2_9BACT